MKTALILGSSGLTGSFVLEKLILDSDFDKIILLNRKETEILNPKIQEIITDFKDEIHFDSIEKLDSIFSCLGTTRKKTPDLNQYGEIEIEIPCMIAKLSLKKGLQSLHFISSVGASSKSTNFYLKIKGEAEEKLASLKIPHLHIYRPSLLIGPRKENRLAEKIFMFIMPIFNPFMIGKATKYKTMQIENLSKSMIAIDKITTTSSIQIHEYDSIMKNIK
jgi:nucleoside-diphosphate-sugar epimerase